MEYRKEQDSMGEIFIPKEAYYGAQTQRAYDNFPISGIGMPKPLIHAMALIKKFAAQTNLELKLLDEKVARAVIQAADEVFQGKFDDQFIIDVFQTGSGTSTHMNMNEVVASRANEIMTGERGCKASVHPNDHVNLGQSSNDVIPSAIHVAAMMKIKKTLLPAMEMLLKTLNKKAREFKNIKKIGRTHLQDALPLTLGDVFSGYGRQVALGKERISGTCGHLSELALGGTAIGTGANTHPEFAPKVIEKLSSHTQLSFRETINHFEAQASQDAAVEVSGALKTVAVSLIKIAGDIRLLASGPRCGLGEIILPALQPGSSIMPGKVNPVIPEAVVQVAYQVIGNDTVITMGGQGGILELNTNLPLIAHNLLLSIELLSSASTVFAEKCLQGIMADADICAGYIEKSLALATALVPYVGYDKAADIAKKAYEEGRTVKETALAESILPMKLLKQLL